jgi:hypothetical protein
MKKLSPYLKTAATVLIVLVIYKIVIQPFIPASIANYAPKV